MIKYLLITIIILNIIGTISYVIHRSNDFYVDKFIQRKIILDNIPDIDVTTIINTCCRHNTPDDSIIKQCIQSLKKIPELTKYIIIVFDGSYINQEKYIHKKCKDKCDNEKYEIYKKKVIKFTKDLYPNSDLQFIEMKERSCLTTSLKKGMSKAKTEYINLMQEDLIINKKFDAKNILKIMNEYDDMSIVRYSKGSNLSHEKYGKQLGIKNIKSIIQINDYIFSKSNEYSDNNHITTKTFYDKHVWPRVKSCDFMEHSISISDKMKDFPSEMWYIGDYNDGNYIRHLDGRNN